jgi:murein endopeptidase
MKKGFLLMFFFGLFFLSAGLVQAIIPYSILVQDCDPYMLSETGCATNDLTEDVYYFYDEVERSWKYQLDSGLTLGTGEWLELNEISIDIQDNVFDPGIESCGQHDFIYREYCWLNNFLIEAHEDSIEWLYDSEEAYDPVYLDGLDVICKWHRQEEIDSGPWSPATGLNRPFEGKIFFVPELLETEYPVEKILYPGEDLGVVTTAFACDNSQMKLKQEEELNFEFSSLGQYCDYSFECETGVCADGVCCDQKCDWGCSSCASEGNEGSCVQKPENTTCGNGKICTLEGECKKELGVKCSLGEECLSGNCNSGVCCNVECEGGCEYCNKPGKVGTCIFRYSGYPGLDYCPAGEVCDGYGGCKEGKVVWLANEQDVPPEEEFTDEVIIDDPESVNYLCKNCYVTPYQETEAVGKASDGFLLNGVRLLLNDPSSPYLSARKNNYGTIELIRSLEAASCYMNQNFGGVKLQINDLSKEKGGEISGHASHESGLDVDTGIFTFSNGNFEGELSKKCLSEIVVEVNSEGKEVKKVGCKAGKVYDSFNNPEALRANWEFLKKLNQIYDVQFIFLDKELINPIKKYATSIGEGHLWGEVGGVLKHWPNHHHHYHIRLKCPLGDKKCKGAGAVKETPCESVDEEINNCESTFKKEGFQCMFKGSEGDAITSGCKVTEACYGGECCSAGDYCCPISGEKGKLVGKELDETAVIVESLEWKETNVEGADLYIYETQCKSKLNELNDRVEGIVLPKGLAKESTLGEVCADASFETMIIGSLPYPTNLKKWEDAIKAEGLPGKTWMGKLDSNGPTDEKFMEDVGRDSLLFIPCTTDLSQPLEIFYFLHGNRGFGGPKDLNDFKTRAAPKIKEMGLDGRNIIWVIPELPWSSGDESKQALAKGTGRAIPKRQKSLLAKGNLEGIDFVQFHQDIMVIIEELEPSFDESLVTYISMAGHSAGGAALWWAAESGALETLAVNKITFSDADYFGGAKKVWAKYFGGGKVPGGLGAEIGAELNLLVQDPSNRGAHNPTASALSFIKKWKGNLPDNINYVPLKMKHRPIGKYSLSWVSDNPPIEAADIPYVNREIIEDGSKKEVKVYFYFHGNTKSTQSKSFVESYVENYDLLENMAGLEEKTGEKGVLVVLKGASPNSVGNSGQWMKGTRGDESWFSCFYDEALVKLDDLGLKPTSMRLMSHSAGGKAIRNIVNSGFLGESGLLPLESVSYYDSCYGGWCSDVMDEIVDEEAEIFAIWSPEGASPQNKVSAFSFLTGMSKEEVKGMKNGDVYEGKEGFENTVYAVKVEESHGDVVRKCFYNYISDGECEAAS